MSSSDSCISRKQSGLGVSYSFLIGSKGKFLLKYLLYSETADPSLFVVWTLLVWSNLAYLSLSLLGAEVNPLGLLETRL